MLVKDNKHHVRQLTIITFDNSYCKLELEMARRRAGLGAINKDKLDKVLVGTRVTCQHVYVFPRRSMQPKGRR